MSKLIHIPTISIVHELLNFEPPTHPLVSVVRHTNQMNTDVGDVRVSMGFYFVSLKEHIKGSFNYGRNTYDFKEGTLVFTAPHQIMKSNGPSDPDIGGWTLFFHPDLIRKYALGNTISSYSFFNYEATESLHISQNEKQALTEFVLRIEDELKQEMDHHSQGLIVHNIESILLYSQRYYDRQFLTRTQLNQDHLSKFEKYLNNYFDTQQQLTFGIPTVDECGKAMNMSGSYLSDLLKSITGKSLIEHLHLQIINRAKNQLLNSNQSISQIAYALGFEYPQYFSKLFKAKTGMSPTHYRNTNP